MQLRIFLGFKEHGQVYGCLSFQCPNSRRFTDHSEAVVAEAFTKHSLSILKQALSDIKWMPPAEDLHNGSMFKRYVEQGGIRGFSTFLYDLMRCLTNNDKAFYAPGVGRIKPDSSAKVKEYIRDGYVHFYNDAEAFEKGDYDIAAIIDLDEGKLIQLSNAGKLSGNFKDEETEIRHFV
ncbi:hypothetical protein ACFCP7_24580 [Paenibacillus elgii]